MESYGDSWGPVIKALLIWFTLSLVLFITTIVRVARWSQRAMRQHFAVDPILAAAAFVAVEVFGVLLYVELSGNSGKDGAWAEWPYMAGAAIVCVGCIVGIVKRPTARI